MKRNLRRQLLLALALAAVIVGVVIAVFSGGGGQRSKLAGAGRTAPLPGTLAIAARYLDTTTGLLRRRLRVQTLGEVANTTAGRSAAGLEEALLAAREAQWRAQKRSPAEEAARTVKARERIAEAVRRRRRSPGAISLAAGYLGMSEEALRSELVRGHSLASLAGMRAGTTRGGLIALIVASRTKAIEGALATRQITQQQERSAIALLRKRVVREVDRALP